MQLFDLILLAISQLVIILLNFSVLSVIFILRKNENLIYFLMLLFYIEPFLDIFFLILFNFVFFFLWQVFMMLFCLFFYSFFGLFIILNSFFFRIIFFCFSQDFLPIKPVIIQFCMLVWQINKKFFFLLIHNCIFISHFSFLFLNFYFYSSTH